jgi:hypothetical protein
VADKSKSSLEEAIKTTIDSMLKEVHTCLPAVVERVDHVNQLIDAQITIKRKLSDELVNLPLLVDVPLRYWRSGTFSITFPIEVGDHVKIIFAERSIDTWLTNGGIQNPFDVRKFSLSDAFAEPVMYPQTDVIPSFDTANLEIKTNDGAGSIKITPSGDIYLNGSADSTIAYTDMKAAFDQLVTEFNTHTHSGVTTGSGTSGVPSTPSTADMSAAEVSNVKVP